MKIRKKIKKKGKTKKKRGKPSRGGESTFINRDRELQRKESGQENRQKS